MRMCLLPTVPSQVILSKTLNNERRLMSVATKIAIQINCKLGGDAWCVTLPVSDLSLR